MVCIMNKKLKLPTPERLVYDVVHKGGENPHVLVPYEDYVRYRQYELLVKAIEKEQMYNTSAWDDMVVSYKRMLMEEMESISIMGDN